MTTGQDNFARQIAAARASLVAALWVLRSIVSRMYDGVKAVARRPRRAAAAAVLAAAPAQAALITQAEPFVDGDYVKLPHQLVNDDNQAEFDSFGPSSFSRMKTA